MTRNVRLASSPCSIVTSTAAQCSETSWTHPWALIVAPPITTVAAAPNSGGLSGGKHYDYELDLQLGIVEEVLRDNDRISEARSDTRLDDYP